MSPVCLTPAAGAVHRPAWPGPETPPRRPAAAPLRERSLRAAVRRHGLAAGQDLPDLCSALGVEPAALLAAHGTLFERAESPLKTRRLRALVGPDTLPAIDAFDALGALQLRLQCPAAAQLQLELAAGEAGALLQRAMPDAGVWAQAQAWAVEEHLPCGTLRRSVQVLDRSGRPLLALRLAAAASPAAFFALVDRFGSLDLRGTPPPSVPAARWATARTATDAGSRAELRRHWAALRRPDDREAVLQHFGLRLGEACALLAPEQALPLQPAALHELFSRAAQAGLALHLGLHSQALSLQTAFEPRRLALAGGRLQIGARSAALVLQESAVHTLCALRLNTPGGVQHRIQAFDADGEHVLELRAQAEAGQREPCTWRWLVDSVGRDSKDLA